MLLLGGCFAAGKQQPCGLSPPAPCDGLTAAKRDALMAPPDVQVCAGICPFNFPAMIPLWMFPIACTAGNTFVLKPSEKDPGASLMLAELAMEAGLPKCAHPPGFVMTGADDWKTRSWPCRPACPGARTSSRSCA